MKYIVLCPYGSDQGCSLLACFKRGGKSHDFYSLVPCFFDIIDLVPCAVMLARHLQS